ncbi:hypothetical protein [Saccharibacillus sp. JS10]|uniref:hypothetical protein n=1 Tax=Saccharibacillus sp. JS10 TaxID=2950552 RepID=UPI00210E3488|nr:hypothetical protein [Saccharibacillus sp. JS10]MCQ4087544.1 hypothetical protein [Saccharibacillus sp. JS10]
MIFRHVMLEVYCSKFDQEGKTDKECTNKQGDPGYQCLSENCPNVSYTYANHEIAYVGELGETSDSRSFIGFGGDMVPDDANENEEKELKGIWEEICRQKIQEAYDEYMLRLKSKKRKM